MSYAVAAAGTGGHVFPGLAVGEALVEAGVPRSDVLYLGGNRLETRVYPEHGFPFLGVELRGLSRAFTARNLAIPGVVRSASRAMASELRDRGVSVVLGMGGYVTVPAALAARRVGARLAVSEQNAEAGLANAVVGRVAHRVFGAFPTTRRLPRAEWVGNPIRRELARFDREALRSTSHEHYRLDPARPVLGVFGGSLGAGVINGAVERLVRSGDDPPQILHLAGEAHVEALSRTADRAPTTWRVVGFEAHMELFYAAADLVIARAGGAVAELAATATPSVLVPGSFGSGRHQHHNAAVFAAHGAAEVLAEDELDALPALVRRLLADPDTLARMAAACRSLAKPDAAATIAGALRELHG